MPEGGCGTSKQGRGRGGEVLVILLTGGTKKRQPRDITRAKELWADYKRRRRPPAR